MTKLAEGFIAMLSRGIFRNKLVACKIIARNYWQGVFADMKY